jgi:DNA (cytosine-5)-methyltransferase 1
MSSASYAYYNENDPRAAAWLRELIAQGHIAPGYVDERSIVEVQPDDVREFTQVHLFAGIGGWSYALRLAGWPDDCPIWTGSCPCQPFSVAGRRTGTTDTRHLWPEMYRLISECHPAIAIGEQVARKAGLGWLDAVFADMEREGYACGAADLAAASVGAPHIRQRLYWAAYDDEGRCQLGELEHPTGARREGYVASPLQRGGEAAGKDECAPGSGDTGGLAHASRERRQQERRGAHGNETPDGLQGDHEPPGDGADSAIQSRKLGDPCSATGGFWFPCDWLPCRDGNARPVEPGTFPLVARLPQGVVYGGDLRMAANESQEARVMRLRGYGNAIVAPLAQAFIESVMEVIA